MCDEYVLALRPFRLNSFLVKSWLNCMQSKARHIERGKAVTHLCRPAATAASPSDSRIACKLRVTHMKGIKSGDACVCCLFVCTRICVRADTCVHMSTWILIVYVLCTDTGVLFVCVVC
jgi:hypothetical protein